MTLVTCSSQSKDTLKYYSSRKKNWQLPRVGGLGITWLLCIDFSWRHLVGSPIHGRCHIGRAKTKIVIVFKLFQIHNIQKKSVVNKI